MSAQAILFVRLDHEYPVELAAAQPARFAVIDGARAPEAVAAEAARAVDGLLA